MCYNYGEQKGGEKWTIKKECELRKFPLLLPQLLLRLAQFLI
nr:MAG TPA: hypothetical protein [Caudoviricetes sp.]